MKSMIYLLIASSAMGAGILSIKLTTGLSLFPYRIMLILVICFSMLMVLFNRWGLDISHIKVKPYIRFLLIWILYAAISYLWSKDRGSTLKDVISLCTNISLIIIVIYFFRSLKDYEKFYNLWLLIMIPLLGVGLWNHITGQQLTEYTFKIAPYAKDSFMHAPRATFTGPNEYATYLSLNIPFVITFIRYGSNKTLKLAGLIGLLLCLYLLIYTQSRANYIAVMFGLIFWYLYLVRNPTTKMAIAMMITALGLLLILFSGPIIATIDDIFISQMTSLTQSTEEGSVNIRMNLIKNSVQFLLDSFGLGIGAGNSEYYMRNYGIYNTHGITNVHNWWVELLTEYGVFIFMLYLIFYLSIILKLIRMYKESHSAIERKICESLLACLSIFLFACISSSSLLNFMPQWILFAFCLGFLNCHRIRNSLRVRYQ